MKNFVPLLPQEHTACVSLPAYVKMGGTKLSLVQPGNYSVRLRATSLAGNGSFTETTYFFMPNRKAARHPADLDERRELPCELANRRASRLPQRTPV